MVESLPSRRIGIADVPESSDFTAKFYYNFFTSDESVNENGTVPSKYLEYTAARFNQKVVDTIDFDRNVPRYVQIDWRPVVVSNGIRRNYVPDIKNNVQNIYFEDDFTYRDFTSITAQDTNPEETFGFVVKKTLESLKSNAESKLEGSHQDLAKKLNQNSPADVDSKFLETAFDIRALNVKFYKNNGEEVKNELYERLKKSKLHVQLNNKLIYDVVSNASLNDVSSPFSDEYSSILPVYKQLQDNAAQTRNSSMPSLLDYDFEIDKPVFYYKMNSDGFESTLQTVGYMIEKTEFRSDGTSYEKEPIIVQGENIGSTYDIRIKYGSSYLYRLRTVSYVEIQGIEENYGLVAAVGFFVASKPTFSAFVSCTEDKAPPPPADFNARWNYSKNQMSLEWNFPVETQRDVKKFQVFRRFNVFEPFELLVEYDFDDSQVPAVSNEFPGKELVKKMTNPSLYFVDPEFKRSSKFIYAVCCIDAHGFSSPYSMQLEVWFDSSKNKLMKNLVSVAGAIKQYPNMYLNKDTFVDSIKDEWHKKVTIAFNPEYLKVTNNNGNDLELLRTNDKEKYILQIINLDLQTQENVEIRLLDRTTNNFLTRPISNNDMYTNRNVDVF